MTLEVVTSTTGKPVTLQDAKEHLNITDNNDDNRVFELIDVATDYVERAIGGERQLMQATYDDTLPHFPHRWHHHRHGTARLDRIYLKRPPLQSVTSVTYFDESEVSTILPSTDYHVITPDESQGFIQRRHEIAWPATFSRPDAVVVRFIAGYADAESVPITIKHAMKLLIGHYNENREALLVGTISKPIEFGVDSLLAHHRWGFYG